jgi:hypothetical protein
VSYAVRVVSKESRRLVFPRTYGSLCVNYICDYKRGLDWKWDLLATLSHVIIIINVSAVADLHPLQITRAHAKSFPACGDFTSSCLVTAPTVYSPASFTSSRLLTPRHGSPWKTAFQTSPLLLVCDSLCRRVCDRYPVTAVVYFLISRPLSCNVFKRHVFYCQTWYVSNLKVILFPQVTFRSLFL